MCDNMVDYYVPKGYDYKLVQTKCGITDVHGGRALCDKCEADPRTRDEHNRILENSKADNDWLQSAGWGEM